MSNLKNELIITTTWLCNNRATCGRENQTVVNTARFPSYVPPRVMANCAYCGEIHAVWISPGWEAETVSRTVAAGSDGSEMVEVKADIKSGEWDRNMQKLIDKALGR